MNNALKIWATDTAGHDKHSAPAGENFSAWWQQWEFNVLQQFEEDGRSKKTHRQAQTEVTAVNQWRHD